jgi:hypothetical protein
MKSQTNRILSGASLLRGARGGSSLSSVERMKGSGSLPFYHEQLREISSDLWHSVIDSMGNPRLNLARNLFLPLDLEKVSDLEAIYGLWKDHHEVLILKGENLQTGEIRYIGVKCSKRGNDVCSQRQLKKIRFLKQLKKDAYFFSMEDAFAGKALSNVVWVTLTFDSKLSSLHDAWLHLAFYITRFLKNLEKKYGEIEHFLTPEVYPDQNGAAFGYPHVHMILLFKEAKFRVFPWMEKDEEGKETLCYRIKEKDDVAEAGEWHSFIDVKALRNANGVASYCRKHIENTIQGESSEAAINNAVMWLYRKKSYSMSHGFRECFVEFIVAMQVFPGGFQVDLMGNRVFEWKWSFLGIVHGSRVGMDPNIWTADLDPAVVQDVLRERKGELFMDEWEESGRGLGSGSGGRADD